MTALVALIAALFGGLAFARGRRSRWYYTDQDNFVIDGGDVICDSGCDDGCASDSYDGSAAAADSEDWGPATAGPSAVRRRSEAPLEGRHCLCGRLFARG